MMGIKNIKSARGQWFVALLVVPLLLVCGFALLLAQQAPVMQQAPVIGEKEIWRLVEEALPHWNAEVLKIRDREDWSKTLDFDAVFKAVGDKAIPVEKLPHGAKRLADPEKVVRLDLARGKIRYISRARAWKFDEQATSKALEADKAREIVLKVMAELGIPRDEVVEPRVATQVAAAAPVGSETVKYEYEMYRIVTVLRTLNKLPVYGSKVRTGVSNKGQIQRLQVDWPAFRLSPNLSLRTREAVVKEVVNEIMRQRPAPDTRIQAYLAYAPRSLDDEEIWFVPAVIVSVYSPPTPYQLVIPVAQVKGEPGTKL